MSEKIDINTADVATLTAISGIGPALAERIIEYRQTVHPFEEVIELAAVPGISEKMVRGFEALVTVQLGADATAVSPELDADASEDILLLDAPDQPQALLAAELPDAPPEVEDITVTDTTPEAPEQADEIEEAVSETAVPPTQPPELEMEDLPLADPSGPAMPEPDSLTALPDRPPREWEARARRRGCLSTLLGATFGAILGAALTLAVLAALNGGTLNYADSNTQLRRQLDTEIISRTNELNQLATRVSLAATQEAAANQALQDDFTTADEAINETLTSNERLISDLDQQLQDVAGAAQTFNDFIDGLRGLLNDLDEGTATATPAPAEETASPTATPTPASTSTTATPTPASTTAVRPTRTPQPTATSFTFPTNTPAPQP